MSKHKHNKPFPNTVLTGGGMIASVITQQDVRELIAYCNANIDTFDRLGTKQGRNIFIPGNADPKDKAAKVLAVGHLDHYTGKLSCTGTMLTTPALDDRLGVWAICRKLPSMVNGGRRYDILLTRDEERGLSSADEFCKQADKYNWIFELDRRGTDAAYYGFSDDMWLEALGGDGWDLSTGSFTDICAFEEGSVSAVNFGIAYENEHTTACSVNFRKLGLQLQRIASFYNHYKDTRFVHDGMAYPRHYGKGAFKSSKYTSPYAWSDDYYDIGGKTLQRDIRDADMGATPKKKMIVQNLRDWSFVQDTSKTGGK